MSDQQFRSMPPQYRLAIGLSLFAVFLIIFIVAGLLAPGGDFMLVYLNLITGIAVLTGVFGLLIYAARQLGWSLPSFLQVSEERRDENWRLLAMSLAVIALPLIVIVTRHLLLH